MNENWSFSVEGSEQLFYCSNRVVAGEYVGDAGYMAGTDWKAHPQSRL